MKDNFDGCYSDLAVDAKPTFMGVDMASTDTEGDYFALVSIHSDGSVTSEPYTVKDAAIEEIKFQPFF